jgi:lycopene cyclase domain-containing protein
VSYTTLAAVSVLAAAGLDLLVLRTMLLRRKAFWTSYAILLLFQLVVNGILTGLPVVRYDPATIVGLRLWHAPVEDLLYGFGLILITLSGWVWLGRRSVAAGSARGPGRE